MEVDNRRLVRWGRFLAVNHASVVVSLACGIVDGGNFAKGLLSRRVHGVINYRLAWE